MDKRSITSAQNGAQGGRPKRADTIMFTIKRVDIVASLKNDDLAFAIEKAFKRRFPKLSVYVQTRRRLEKENVNYDPYSGINNLVIINSVPFKFPWELRYFVGEFIALTKGKKDFSFPMRLPKHILEGK